jgi:hypothetical protein
VTEDGDTFLEVPIDYQGLVTNTPSLTGAQEYTLGGYNKGMAARKEKYGYLYNDKIIPYPFNYAYAITVWKAQGSQYKDVLAYDAQWLLKRNPQEYAKYIYTAITRAEEKLILVGD